METRKPGPSDIHVTVLDFGARAIIQPGIKCTLAVAVNSAQVLENIGAVNFKLSETRSKNLISFHQNLY